MKQNFLYILGIVATLLVVSCTQEDLQKTDAEEFSNLVISVTDGGFIPKETTSDVPTRASENDFRTEFTAGDACGLYIVRDGKIIAENIKLTAAGTSSNVTWSADADNEPFGGLPNEDYYLYYPYQENMDGKIETTATADAEFFAPLIKDWQPQEDQSDYKTGYAASDLMTAEGVLTEKGDGTLSLSFSMTHRMAMVVLQVPEITYKFTNNIIPDYKEILSVSFFYGKIMNTLKEGIHRYLFNPQQGEIQLTGGYKYSISIMFDIIVNNQDIPAGKYKTFYLKSSKPTTINYQLDAGDFFCKNSVTGNWYIIPRLTMPNKDECIGIVFYAGHHPDDDTNYLYTGIGKQQCNGYVMAMKNLDVRQWCVRLESAITTSKDENKWNGYSNQQMLKSRGLDNYPAAKFCADYSLSAPVRTSGWFLPSLAQVKYALNKTYSRTKPSVDYFQVRVWGRHFWSSTTQNVNTAQFVLGTADNYWTGTQEKDHNQDIMPILAF